MREGGAGCWWKLTPLQTEVWPAMPWLLMKTFLFGHDNRNRTYFNVCTLLENLMYLCVCCVCACGRVCANHLFVSQYIKIVLFCVGSTGRVV